MNLKEIKNNFFVFLALFTIIGIVGRSLSFDTIVFGKNLSLQISELMMEHEAVKTLFLVSVILIVVGFLRATLSILNIDSEFIRENISVPVSNFISTLAATSAAISLSVYITSIHIVGILSPFIVIVFINLILASSLIFALYMFCKEDITTKVFLYGATSSTLYLLLLYRDVVFFS